MRAATANRLRVDAQRNRERILAAAYEVFVAHGPDAPLDAIARRAGVGIATVYRRFPDRASLIHGVAIDAWARISAAMQDAIDSEPTAYAALRRFMHAALDVKVGAIMPALLGRVAIDDELDRIRHESVEQVQDVIAKAQADGDVRPDVGFGDVMLANVRLSCPLPSRLLAEDDVALGHRQLEIYVAGLGADHQPLPGSNFGPDEFDALVRMASAGSADEEEDLL